MFQGHDSLGCATDAARREQITRGSLDETHICEVYIDAEVYIVGPPTPIVANSRKVVVGTTTGHRATHDWSKIYFWHLSTRSNETRNLKKKSSSF